MGLLTRCDVMTVYLFPGVHMRSDVNLSFHPQTPLLSVMVSGGLLEQVGLHFTSRFKTYLSEGFLSLFLVVEDGNGEYAVELTLIDSHGNPTHLCQELLLVVLSALSVDPPYDVLNEGFDILVQQASVAVVSV